MTDIQIKDGETLDEFIYRAGKLKESGESVATWAEVALAANETGVEFTRESVRKRYYRMKMQKNEPPTEYAQQVVHDDHVAINRSNREFARVYNFRERLIEACKQVEPMKHSTEKKYEPDKPRAIVAMLSDIHYGIEFDNRLGKYNTAIAAKRVMDYADYLVKLGLESGADVVYVPLMGDMISGVIKSTIRIENRESLVEQITGVAELIVCFLCILAVNFKYVHVYSVDGNHSRIDITADTTLRNERLDAIIMWYCKARLLSVDNITCHELTLDQTVTYFDVFNKKYVCVHGDLDKSLQTSLVNLESILGFHIDYFLAAHTHVPEMRLERVGYYRNGCVCGTGDDYTARLRHSAPACQVALLCDDTGVISVHPFTME